MGVAPKVVVDAVAGAGSFGAAVKILMLLTALVVNTLVFVLVFRVASGRRLSAREVAPGAVAAAVLWQLLQTFGVAYVGHVVSGTSATNGVFAIVLGLLAFLYAAAVLVVICAEVNAVRVDKLYPRSLLTPFTDNVELTRGDRRSYSDQAKAQRSKGFEEVNVTFHPQREQEEDADTAQVADRPPRRHHD
jgi:membrane protein